MADILSWVDARIPAVRPEVVAEAKTIAQV